MTEHYTQPMPEPRIPVTAMPFGLPKSSNGKCTYFLNEELGEVTLLINIRSDVNGTLYLGNIGQDNTPAVDIIKLIPQWSKTCKPKNLQINKDGAIYILESEKGAWYKTQVTLKL